jgi:hypothetical protein
MTTTSSSPTAVSGSIPPPPPDQPAVVSISPVTGRVVAGIPFGITVELDQGEHWVWLSGDQSYDSEPKVSYTGGLDVAVDGGAAQLRDHRSFTGGPVGESVTIATAGNHTLTAVGHSDGGDIGSAAVAVHVSAAGPPAFTVSSPVSGATVDLNEGGGQVTVALTTTSDYLPVSAFITVDGVTGPALPVASASFQTTVNLGPMPLGARPIGIALVDRDGLGSTQTRTVTGRDIAAPHVAVSQPKASANIVGDGTGAVTVHMVGTATDTQAGMAGGSSAVAWSLSPTGTPAPAKAATGTDFGNWTAEVPLTGFGAHTIYVWATDQAGNKMAAPLEVPVVVISTYTPKTLTERLNEREYLAALLSFVRDQVVTSGTAHVDTATLVTVLGQPLDRISQPLSPAADRGSQEINQLRVPVEVLRAYLAATNTPAGPGASGEAAYRDAAYANLLAAAGTSYQELRLTRGAAVADRQALAARLGVRLSATRPDALDQLVLDGAGLTEAALETMFGLLATAGGDPLRAPGTPQLLAWQLGGLTLTWADQDQHPNQPLAFAVLADPDLIGPGDLAPGPKGDSVQTVLTQRGAQLSTFAGQLDTIRAANPANPGAALTAMQTLALPGVDLADLEAKEAQGVDIGAALDAAGLNRAGFGYLRELSRLTATGTVTAAEWTDAIAALTNAFKRRQYPAWRAQETGFVLSPDFFVLADAAPAVNPYRADTQARSDWQSVLRSRIAQRQDLIDGSAQAVAGTEQAALPVLRDALLADLAPADNGESMSTRFMIDMLAGGTLRTTRMRQAIESLQSLLIAMRSGDLPTSHPAATWTFANPDAFVNAWIWMGELGSWQSATTAFLFPERHLDPTLLFTGADGTPSAALNTLYTTVRGSGPFGATDAIGAATAYLNTSGIALPAHSYPNPTRSKTLQSQVHAVTKPLDRAGREVSWVVPLLLGQRLQSAGEFQSALDWYWLVYPYDLAGATSIFDTIAAEKTTPPDLTFPSDWTTRLNPFTLIAGRPAPYTRYTLLCIIGCHLDYADAEFARETDESIAHARTLYVAARRLLGNTALQPQTPSNIGEPPLAIPELDALGSRADLQLAKLRQGRNIAGMPRTQPAGGVTISQPTPYRFRTLMERAKQLVAQAAQTEAGYLAALEKYDDRNLRLYDTLKAIDLNAAQVNLAGSRVQEADDAVTTAAAQVTKADAMVRTYTDAIAAPPNQYEQDLLNDYQDMRTIRSGIVLADTAIGIMQAASNSASLFDEVLSGGSKAGLAVGIMAATEVKGGLELAQTDLDARMQASQLQAGIEQRRNEWRIQQATAQQDALVARAQVTVADDQVSIAIAEQDISQLQYNQAVASLKFLNDQFTNADLYLWMSNTLGGVYRYFLQQATAVARLAQAQLAFERAEQPQSMVRDDYWQAPAELMSNAGQADRRGLTGAEQLGQDLARLDDYAFSTERRRLNLSQTFSLARLMPVEFLDFRRTGTIAFATPMALFDADFPGHYLRLIRQVRTSIVGLLPPDRGPRATLLSTGISRVTTGRDGAFADVVLRHDPGVVALTSAVAASGVFELDAQSDMLLPFESSGVDTTWELRLPPAANPFDFSTIVDVMITIEYTALYDDTYRGQTINRLNADRGRGADLVFSLSRDFPDQWYDLHNPAGPGARTVTLALRDVDFPAGIDALSTAAVAVQLSSSQPVPPTVVTLNRGAAGGAATTFGGIASTRRGNAAAWTGLYGPNPAGDWQLTFGADAAALLDAEALDDIVLVISWTGQAPAWLT